MEDNDFKTACKFIIFGWFALPIGLALHFGPWIGLATLGAESLAFGTLAAVTIKTVDGYFASRPES